MHISRIVEEAFQELEAELAHMLEGLSPEDLDWRPDQDANSISFLMWHIGRAEDIFVSDYAFVRPRSSNGRDGPTAGASQWTTRDSATVGKRSRLTPVPRLPRLRNTENRCAAKAWRT